MAEAGVGQSYIELSFEKALTLPFTQFSETTGAVHVSHISHFEHDEIRLTIEPIGILFRFMVELTNKAHHSRFPFWDAPVPFSLLL